MWTKKERDVERCRDFQCQFVGNTHYLASLKEMFFPVSSSFDSIKAESKKGRKLRHGKYFHLEGLICAVTLKRET